MKIFKVFKIITCYILSFLLGTQTFAISQTPQHQNLLFKSGELSSTQLKRIADKHSANFRNSSDSIKFLKNYYTKSKDIEYLDNIIKKNPNLNELPKVIAKQDSLLINVSDNVKIKISNINLLNKSMSINGIQHKFLASDSLEVAHTKIIKILEKTINRKVSFIEFLIPSAYAVDPKQVIIYVTAGLIALALVLPAMLMRSHIESVEEDLDEIIALCGDRIYVPYNGSELHSKYEDFIASNRLNMDAMLQHIDDCSRYAKLAKKTYDIPMSLELHHRTCEKSATIHRCIEDNKNPHKIMSKSRQSYKESIGGPHHSKSKSSAGGSAFSK